MSNLVYQMQASVKDADKNLRNLHLANEDGSHLSQTFSLLCNVYGSLASNIWKVVSID